MKTKQCTKCKEIKSISEFNKDKSHSKNGLHSHCKTCVKKYYDKNKIRHSKRNKEYYQKHKIKISEYNKKYGRTEEGKIINRKKALKYYYDITLGQYDDMFDKQNGVCAICAGVNKNGRRLCIDHDHETNEVRGLLCHRCNLLLGNSKENIIILQSMINYLKNYKV